jgi:hypothetical protein
MDPSQVDYGVAHNLLFFGYFLNVTDTVLSPHRPIHRVSDSAICRISSTNSLTVALSGFGFFGI